MIKAEKQILFAQVCHQREEIVAPSLQLDVLTLGDVIDAHVEFCAAGTCARHLLAQKEIRVTPQSFGGIYGIVIRNCDQIHPAAIERLINFQRIVVTLAANAAQQRNRTHSGMNRMHMQIATHALLLLRESLQLCELVITIRFAFRFGQRFEIRSSSNS